MEDAIAGKHSELVGRLQAHLEVGRHFLGPLPSS